MAYELIYEGRGFFIKQSEKVSIEEIAHINDEILSHEKWSEHTYQIWSYLEAWAIEGDNRDARIISKIDNMSLNKSHDHPIKIAFLSKNSKTTEIIEAYMDSVDERHIKAKLFLNEQDARDWIGKSR